MSSDSDSRLLSLCSSTGGRQKLFVNFSCFQTARIWDGVSRGLLVHTIGPNIESSTGMRTKLVSRPQDIMAMKETNCAKRDSEEAVVGENGHTVCMFRSIKSSNSKRTLTIVLKTLVELSDNGITPSHVVKPPINMEVPIVSNVSLTFSSLVVPVDS
jgi:hypothetical protein